MKQRRFGQKVQNWHRPLGPNELSASYRRQRNIPPGVITTGGLSEEDTGFEYRDYDDDDDAEYEYWLLSEGPPDFQDLGNRDLIWSVCNPNRPLNSLWQLFSPEIPLPPLIYCPAEELIELLARHVEQVTHQPNDLELTEAINNAIGCNEARKLVQQHLPKSAEVICLFAPFWCRSPLTWNPEGGKTLAEHLFALYSVPSFLLEATRSPIRFPDYKWLCWLILMGRSISLKKVARVFDWDISSKLPHYIMQVDVSVRNPVEGVACAEVLRLGGTEQDFRRVIADIFYQIDITDPSQSEAELSFWRETVRWLIAHRDELTDLDSQRILAWACHCHTEGEAGHSASFSWSGRSVEVTRERAEVYDQEQSAWFYRGGKDYTWNLHGWDWEEENGWSIAELTSSRHLAIEGAAMHHCVGSYGWRCYTDASAIFSVRYQDQRQVTVELCPQTKRIVQVHGLYNRYPTAEERAVVARWHQTIVTAPA